MGVNIWGRITEPMDIVRRYLWHRSVNHIRHIKYHNSLKADSKKIYAFTIAKNANLGYLYFISQSNETDLIQLNTDSYANLSHTAALNLL